MPSNDAMWHIKRKQALVKAHPEIKTDLEGVYYPSAVYVVALSMVQWGLFYGVDAYLDWSLGSMLLMGVLVFANINTALYSLSSFIHENSHGLVLGWKNRVLAACLIEMGFNSFGEQWEYTVVHYTMHHPQLNDNEKDSECPDKGHVAYPSENPVMRVLAPWIELLPFGTMMSQGALSNNGKSHMVNYSRTPHYIIMSVTGVVYCTLASMGMWRSILFSLWSATAYASRWNISLHGQSIAEHYHHSNDPSTDGPPTHSTYFWLENFLGFNTGYHDEHHTFPNVAWAKLPQLRSLDKKMFSNSNQRRYLDLWWEWATHGFETSRFRICKK